MSAAGLMAMVGSWYVRYGCGDVCGRYVVGEIQVWLKESQPVSGATAAREGGCVTLCSDSFPVSLRIAEPSDIFPFYSPR